MANDDAQIIENQEESNVHLKSIDKGIQKFLANQANKKLDDLEAQREKGKGGLLAGLGAGAAVATKKPSAGIGLPGLGGLGNTLGKVLGIGALVAGVTAAVAAVKKLTDITNKLGRSIKYAFDDTAKNRVKVNRAESDKLRNASRARRAELRRELKAAEATRKAKGKALADAEFERTRQVTEKGYAEDATENRLRQAEAEKAEADKRAREIRAQEEKLKRIERQAKANKSLDKLNRQAVAKQTDTLRFLQNEAAGVKVKPTGAKPITGPVINEPTKPYNFKAQMSNINLQRPSPGIGITDIRGYSDMDALKKGIVQAAQDSKSALRVLNKALGAAAVLDVAVSADRAGTEKAKADIAKGTATTKASLAAAQAGGAAESVFSVLDLPGAIGNWLAGKGFVSETKFGESFGIATTKATESILNALNLGQEELTKQRQIVEADMASKKQLQDEQRRYAAKIMRGMGNYKSDELKRIEANASRYRSHPIVAPIAPQTNVVDNSSRSNTTVINQQDNPVMAVDYWLYKYGTNAMRNIP